MILLAALAAGLLVGVALARIRGQPYRVPPLRHVWVVTLAFLPQLFAFYVPGVGARMPDTVAAAVLVVSQAVFLAFVWLNRRQPALAVLGAGLFLNLLVICVNRGFMPISPETVSELVTAEGPIFHTGDRFGSKDRIQHTSETQLPWLSDRFVTPPWNSYRAAFSIGDVLISLGAFFFLAIPHMAPNLTSGNPP